MLTQDDKDTIDGEHARYNKKHSESEVERPEFFEIFIFDELAHFKSVNVTKKSSNSMTSKTSKGSQGVDPRDEKTKKKILALQRNSSARTILPFVTAQKVVLQKLSSISQLLDDLADGDADSAVNDGGNPVFVSNTAQTKKSSDKSFLSSTQSVATKKTTTTKAVTTSATKNLES
jgi:hypothetical protein